MHSRSVNHVHVQFKWLMSPMTLSRLATGRLSLVFLGVLLSIGLLALAGIDKHDNRRRFELEEFVLEPIGRIEQNAAVRQMALVQAYRNSMLW